MSAARSVVALAAPLALAALALAGCSAGGASADGKPTDWTIPVYSEAGGCSGSVTMTGTSDWALADDELQRGGQATIGAYCDDQERYAASIDAWDLPTMVAATMPEGACDDAPELDVSGQPGVLCEYDHDGATYVFALAIVGTKYVQVQATEHDADDTVQAEVRDMLGSLVVDVAAPGQEAPSASGSGASGFSAGAECDAYVAAKNADITGANQQAVQISVEDLPFAVADTNPVLCVDAVSTLDAPDEPLGYELIVNAINGEGYNIFAMSPDLSYVECATIEPQGCFEDADGNLVVVGGQSGFEQYFPGTPSILGVGVHMIGYLNG